MGHSRHAELGRRLRAARCRQGLTVAELARVTRIPAWALECLEGGRHDPLPAAAYIRGYLRCCAQALRVPPGMFLSAYNDGRVPRPVTPLLCAAAPRPVTERVPVAFAVAMVTLLVLFVLAAALTLSPRGRAPAGDLVSDNAQSAHDSRGAAGQEGRAWSRG